MHGSRANFLPGSDGGPNLHQTFFFYFFYFIFLFFYIFYYFIFFYFFYLHQTFLSASAPRGSSQASPVAWPGATAAVVSRTPAFAPTAAVVVGVLLDGRAQSLTDSAYSPDPTHVPPSAERLRRAHLRMPFKYLDALTGREVSTSATVCGGCRTG